MNFIKKFAKEISVFGLVIVIFLGLFAYRQMTYKNYTTINSTKLETKLENTEDFILVIGDTSETTTVNYQSVLTTYTTRNRSMPLFFLDAADIDDIETYVEETLDSSAAYPATFIIKNGKVTHKKEGAMNYYSLFSFVEENY